MKILFVFVVLCVACPLVSTAQDTHRRFPQIFQSADSVIPPDPYDSGADYTALDLEMIAGKYRDQMDSTLKFVYRTILSDYKEDTVFTGKLKLSEEGWLKYRDAELAAILPYPHDWYAEQSAGVDFRVRYRYDRDKCDYLEDLTKRRIEELMMWYKGTDAPCDNCSFRTPDHVKH